MTRLNELNSQTITGRRFSSMSEDTALGVRALQTRRNLSRLESYLDNAKSADDLYRSAESSMMTISKVSSDAKTRVLQGLNGTFELEDREIIANELNEMQNQILMTINNRFSDRYMFGGSNTVSQPFTIGSGGELLYNNVDVNSIDAVNKTGMRYDPDTGNMVSMTPDEVDHLLNDSIYIDIGIGFEFDTSSSLQEIDPQTALKYSFSGLDVLGFGVNSDGRSQNVYNILGSIADELKKPDGTMDRDVLSSLLGDLDKANENLSNSITKMGADTRYVQFTVEKLEDDKLNLQEKQNTIEFTERSELIMAFKVQEVSYNAALQMGSLLIQKSIFDYMK